MFQDKVDAPTCGSDAPNEQPAWMFVSEEAEGENMDPAERRNMRRNILQLEYSNSQLKKINVQMNSLLEMTGESELQQLRQEKSRLSNKVQMLRQSVRNAIKVEVELNQLWKILSEQQTMKKNNNIHTRKMKKEQQVLTVQEEKISAKLASLCVQREKGGVEMKNLMTDLQAVQDQMDEAQLVLNIKDELIQKQNLDIHHQQEELAKLSNITTDLRQIHQDLRGQLEIRQEEEILAGLGSVLPGEGYFKALNDDMELLSASAADDEDDEDESTEAEEQRDEMPAVEVQAKSWCRHCAEGLVKGATLGILISLAVMVSMVPASITDSVCSLWSTAHFLLEPYCDLHYVALPPV